MKTLIVIAVVAVLWLVVGAWSLSAQQSSQKQIKVSSTQPGLTLDEVLSRYIEALGGRPAMEKVTTRVSIGTVEVVGMEAKGLIQINQKAPDKMVYMMRIPGVISSYEGFNGTSAWMVDSDSNKVRLKKGKELDVARLRSTFYEPLRLKEHYPQMTIKDIKKINYRDGDRQTYVIEAKPAKGSRETLFFDLDSGLLIRHDVEVESVAGKLPVRQYFLDYKEIDGVKVPFTVRQAQDQGSVLIFRFTEIKQNVALDDAEFDRPNND